MAGRTATLRALVCELILKGDGASLKRPEAYRTIFFVIFLAYFRPFLPRQCLLIPSTLECDLPRSLPPESNLLPVVVYLGQRRSNTHLTTPIVPIVMRFFTCQYDSEHASHGVSRVCFGVHPGVWRRGVGPEGVLAWCGLIADRV